MWSHLSQLKPFWEYNYIQRMLLKLVGYLNTCFKINNQMINLVGKLESVLPQGKWGGIQILFEPLTS